MSICVNTVSIEDKQHWEHLYRQYAEFYKMPMSQSTLDNLWQWIHDKNEKFYCIVARNNEGVAVGLMHFREMASPIRGSKVGFLDDLFVDPEHRGKGVVDELFKSLKTEAEKYGWPFVRWITAQDNHRAMGAYDKISDKTAWVTYQMNV